MRMRDELSAVPSSAIAAFRTEAPTSVTCVQEERTAISFQQASAPPQLQSRGTKCPEGPRFPKWGLEESDRRCGLHEVRTSQHRISFVEIQRNLVDEREKSIDLRHLRERIKCRGSQSRNASTIMA
jgi:hypothetical protein